MKKILRVIIPLIIIGGAIFGIIFTNINLKPMSKVSNKVTIKIKEGISTKNIISTLKENDLIRNELFIQAYVKINNINDLKAGNYILDKNMSPKEIFKTLHKGSNIDNEEISITFPEGKNMRAIAKIIDKNTINTTDDVFKVLNNKEYINKLIEKYPFLTETVLNENIYYPLEGYLAPNTYNFKVDAKVEDIFEKMLDETNKIYEENKAKITSNKYNIHEIFTLASIIESEGVTLEDRKNIAGVFTNRLNSGMSLGSDVTTYYAVKVDLGDRDLYQSEINSDNPYNTRSDANAGKLPIGPICNPSKEALEAAISPIANDYYFFVTDKNMKVYFSKTNDEHVNTINELKSEDLWFEY